MYSWQWHDDAHRCHCALGQAGTAICYGVWPRGGSAVYLTSTSSLLRPHAQLYVVDPAGPPLKQALGEWPLQHYQTFIPR